MNAHQQWVEHKGGERPAEATGRVDVRLREGSENEGHADEFYWPHIHDNRCDIVAWRPHVAAQPAPAPRSDAWRKVGAIEAVGRGRRVVWTRDEIPAAGTILYAAVAPQATATTSKDQT